MSQYVRNRRRQMPSAGVSGSHIGHALCLASIPGALRELSGSKNWNTARHVESCSGPSLNDRPGSEVG